MGLLCLQPLLAESQELPPRVVAPTDKAEFRRFILENGLRVILVSDPNFNKSAGSLAVGVGQIDDPFEHVGLAHFLEHMISKGSEKYPDVAGFSNYVSANGGYRNAYTASDHTNYLFEIRHEALEGALDRTAQFLITPIMPEDVTEREVNAVHNEAMRHVQNDLRRMLNVRRELYTPTAGESKFSTGNKETLAGADAAVVREFWEQNYSPERMSLAIASSLSLDELERMARTYFAPIPQRNLPAIERIPEFLPRAESLRLATIEPIKDIRTLYLEFPVPPVRPDYASKPGEFVLSLLNYAGPGSLVETLKDANLATTVGGFTWERTTGYGSLFVAAELTPQGAANVNLVMEHVFAYLDFLREAPFPADFYADQARINNLRETYEDRGEGTNLAVELANAALFYPLEVVERAEKAWGAPNEAAYRRLLATLTPDNMLATLQAKGVLTDRTEKIYQSAYAYTEDSGEAYQRLVSPDVAATFALPAANPFLPDEVSLLAERPMPLIDEPGLKLYYAQDVEFERPRTAIELRFVPIRAQATARTDLLLMFYAACLDDALEAAGKDADRAGVNIATDLDLEGFTLSADGFGDSPLRLAEHIATEMLSLEVEAERFTAIKELVVRQLRSYAQTEAYSLARDRSSNVLREFHYLPDESLAEAADVTWTEVQAAARDFMAVGKLELVIHGHVTPATARTTARDITAAIGAEAAAEDALLRRRHLAIEPGETVVINTPIEGVNSTYRDLYLLPDSSPATRAAATVVGNFMNTPYFDELRTNQQLGYIVGSAAAASRDLWLLLYVIQSSEYDADTQRDRSEAYLTGLADQLAALDEAAWATLIAGARAQFEEKPKSLADKAKRMHSYGFNYDEDWQRRAEVLAALDELTQTDAVALLRLALDPEQARRVVVLLSSGNHAASEAEPSFTDRDAWKAGREYR
jgi:secreted Zn-dependent insulinase-like peptidase